MDAHIKNVEAAAADGNSDPKSGLDMTGIAGTMAREEGGGKCNMPKFVYFLIIKILCFVKLCFDEPSAVQIRSLLFDFSLVDFIKFSSINFVYHKSLQLTN